KQFIPSPIFALLMGAACLEVVASTLFQALLNRAAIWTNVAVMALWSALLVLITALLVGRIGGVALALGYLAAWLSCVVVYALIVVRALPRDAGPAALSCRLEPSEAPL